jgi:hypothetical protein
MADSSIVMAGLVPAIHGFLPFSSYVLLAPGGEISPPAHHLPFLPASPISLAGCADTPGGTAANSCF